MWFLFFSNYFTLHSAITVKGACSIHAYKIYDALKNTAFKHRCRFDYYFINDVVAVQCNFYLFVDVLF